MKLGSLFDGSGGFPLAASLCGITPVWASEIEPYPLRVTTARFPGMKHLGDIRQINGAKIEPVDVITFGSPCQDLSTANGKRAGLKGERSGLFMEAVRIIREMRKKTNGKYPTFIIWENVFGAFSSNKGEDIRIVLEKIAQIADAEVSIPGLAYRGGAGEIVADGYSIAFRTMDAQFWGVPQRRRRIYLVADFGGQRAGQILFEREGLRGDFTQGEETREEAAACIGAGVNQTTACLTASYGTKWNGNAGAYNGEHFVPDRQPCVCLDDQGGERMNVAVEQAGTLRAQTHGHHPCIARIQRSCAGFSAGNSPSAGSVGYQEETSPTLKSTNSGTNAVPAVICYPEVTGTLCGSGAGTSRPAGQCSEPDFCVCIAGNTIGRQIQNGGNGGGVKSNVSYTLNTIDRHAVCSGQREFRSAKTTADANPENGAKNIELGSGSSVTGTLMANCATKQWSGNQEAFGGDYFPVKDYAVRRLMPIECCRLQGFPDWWCEGVEGSDSAQYKMWGNGLSLPCALYVMEGVALAGKGHTDER